MDVRQNRNLVHTEGAENVLVQIAETFCGEVNGIYQVKPRAVVVVVTCI